MPQLDPSPWFSILIFSWTSFIILAPMTISQYSRSKYPLMKTTRYSTSHWHWPWT